MTTIPLGLLAYKRTYSGTPEIRLENRYVEKAPTNLDEHTSLIGRPGTTLLTTLAGGTNRGNYFKEGLFGGDVFIVQGTNLWRRSTAGVETQVTGVVYGTGHPYVTWMKGEGYEYLFIADGLLLQYYNGGSLATGTLTKSGAISTQVINIDSAYYTWSASVNTGPPDGTSAKPWRAKLGANDAESLENMANLIKYAGVPGTDFSSSLPGPSLDYTATSTATTLVITALSSTLGSTATTIFSGANLAWGATTLQGGGTHALVQIETPDGAAAKALAHLAGYVLVSIGNTRKFFWILPGEVTIDALDFAEKESQPDDIEDMLEVGDHVLIMGNGSTEDWYATGDADAPFAPIKGQAYQRGVQPGTAVVVRAPSGDMIILVGNDNIVYSVGPGGVQPLSDNAISERIRTQIRREAGLP